MILELCADLGSLVPGIDSGASRLSVAKVQTTRALYLVFTDAQRFPVAVVQTGREEELRRLHEHAAGLYSRLPDMVPQPLALRPWRHDLWLRAISGLPGLPWFSLARRMRSVEQWLALRGRSLATLRRFQAAVRANPAWLAKTTPAVELLAQLERCGKHGGRLSAAVVERATGCAKDLEAVEAASSPWQHGDFCLNNLMVGPDRLGLIDFEEFGATTVPLHDELSLAFSFYERMEGIPGAPSLREQIEACTRDGDCAAAAAEPSLRGLLCHHLLWRFNRCLDVEQRQAMACRLRSHLERFAARPEVYW